MNSNKKLFALNSVDENFAYSKLANDSYWNGKYYIYANRFCPRRSLDASHLHNYLLSNNLNSVSDPQQANLIFIFSCGHFKHFEDRSILTIEKALENKTAKVIVTGCLPKSNPKILDKYKTKCEIPPDLKGLDQLLQIDSSGFHWGGSGSFVGFHDLHEGSLSYRLKRKLNAEYAKRLARYLCQELLPRSNTSYFSVFSKDTYNIEIARGCVGDCSYCAIKLGTPKFYSHPEEQIVKNFQSGLRQKYRNFALIAGDIGCYGLDINTNLPSLLSKLFAIDGNYEILLWDFNVRWFVKYYQELFPILKANHKKVNRLVIPIQSGSNRILKLMNRHYKIEEVKKSVLDLQKNIPEIGLETHIIAGFPGESEEDFRESLNLIREIGFSHVEVFPYDDKQVTEAFKLPNKVPKKIVRKRKKILEKEVKAAKNLRLKKPITLPSLINF